MNEHPLTTTIAGRSTTSQRFFTKGLIFSMTFPTVSFAIALYTPSPYKEWGLFGACVSISTLLLYTAVRQCLGTSRASTSLPYTLATFLALVPFGIWGTGIVRLVAYSVYGSILGVVALYWLVWLLMDMFKKNGLHR